MQPRLYYTYGGPRQYGLSPIMIHTRKYWEFQAVTSGSIAPVFVGHDPVFQSQQLWIFAPDKAHGWTAKGNSTAHIAVFHLAEPDPLLKELVAAHDGVIGCHLTKSDITWLKAQQAELAQESKRLTQLTHLKVARLHIGLQLMVLDRSSFQPRPLSHNQQVERVERALYWYRQNVHDNPSVKQVAAAVGMSDVHLRRLCHQVYRSSPKDAMQSIRMEYIQQALTDPALTVETAASRFGFADASSLSRSYRQHFGYPPRLHEKGHPG